MAALWNKSMNVRLADSLTEANSFWTRTKGLLGRKLLPKNEALLIRRCNSIHTFFMNFPIDVIFVNNDLIVKKIVSDVAPGRIVWPVWAALHAIEFAAGADLSSKVKIGDQLHVDR